MAIDKEQTAKFIAQVDTVVDYLIAKVPLSFRGQAEAFIREKIVEPMLQELRELVVHAKAPIFFTVGRSGHGKSSLINALVGQEVAAVNAIRPETSGTDCYEIRSADNKAIWRIVDSRGIFESSRPAGAVTEDPVEALTNDIIAYKPDIILHVISAPESRTMGADYGVIRDVRNKVIEATGSEIPFIAVLNKCDTLGSRPRDWPPEEFPGKARLIEDAVDYFRREVSAFFEAEGAIYVDVIATSCVEDEPWNIEALSDVIFEQLPRTAWLDFAEGQRRTQALVDVATRVTTAFANIAAGVTVNPLPVADIALLLPIQMMLIIFIGALAGRPFAKETLLEYSTALGVNVAAGIGFRELVRAVIKFLPFGGGFVSAVVARQGTIGLGKSAIAYFFRGERIDPMQYSDEAATSGQ